MIYLLRRIADLVRRYRLRGEDYARHVGVQVGEGCRIDTYRFGSEPYLISIGDRSRISRNVTFVTHDGAVWQHRHSVPDLDVFGKIQIGKDCYVGPDVYILPGVELGDGCVVGARAVLSRSVPPGKVVAGNPARIVSTTSAYYARMEAYNTRRKGLPADEKRRHLMALPSEAFLVCPMIAEKKPT